MYDIAIIGAGPAGMTAGVYAARKKLKTILLSKDIGGQAAWSSDIENYLGFSMVTGAELTTKFEHHLEKFKDDVELRVLQHGVEKIEKLDANFKIHADGKTITARAVIIAGGKVPRHLDIPGEKEFLNKGVSYCAWCDGPIFEGKDIVVAGGGNAALDAVLNVSKMVRNIYVVNLAPELTADPVMVDKVMQLPHVRVMNNTELLRIVGDKFLSGVEVKDRDKGTHKTLDVEGIFIEVGSVPATDYLHNFLKLNHEGEIIIDKNNMTSQAGVFAAGDITDVIEKQIIVAAGEGAKAAIQASQYLTKQKH